MYQNIPITAWAVEDRPREKMLSRGISSLTNAELIAILLGSGNRDCSAIELSQQLLSSTGGLVNLAKSQVSELKKFKGIGNAKAISLVAAFELGRRKATEGMDRIRVGSSKDAADYLMPQLVDLDHEVFHVLFLNQSNEIKAEKQLFSGGVNSTIVDARLVLREALNHLASGMILIHNHPSGNLTPSQADIQITKKLAAGAKLVDMRVMDHIIVSSRGYYSFADEGMMPE